MKSKIMKLTKIQLHLTLKREEKTYTKMKAVHKDEEGNKVKEEIAIFLDNDVPDLLLSTILN